MATKNLTETTPVVSSKINELEQRVDNHIQQEKDQDAAMDAAERKLRAVINQRSQERVAEMEAAQAKAERVVAGKKARAKRLALKTKQMNAFLLRTFTSLIIAACLCSLYTIGWIHFWIAMPGIGVAALYCIGNFVAYATRNKRKGE